MLSKKFPEKFPDIIKPTILIALCFLPMLAGACRSASGASRPSVPRGPLPWADQAGFFLLPSPLAPDSSISGKSGKTHRPVALFSAPLLEAGYIEEIALNFEEISRKALGNRLERVYNQYCARDQGARADFVQSLKDRMLSEFRQWESAQARYERELQFRLRTHFQKSYREEMYLAALGNRKLVKQLERERFDLVRRTWKTAADFLKKDLSEDPEDSFCLSGDITPPLSLPRERLYQPLYLARYRFYIGLPPQFRQKLILQLHK